MLCQGYHLHCVKGSIVTLLKKSSHPKSSMLQRFCNFYESLESRSGGWRSLFVLPVLPSHHICCI